MGLLNLDISKLTPSQTWQVIFGVLIIGGGIVAANIFYHNKKYETIQSMVTDTWTQGLIVEHEVEILSDNTNGIYDTLDRLENKIDNVQATQDNQIQSINELGWHVRNRNEFTPEQFKMMLDSWMEKYEKHSSRNYSYESDYSPYYKTTSDNQ